MENLGGAIKIVLGTRCDFDLFRDRFVWLQDLPILRRYVWKPFV